MKRVQFDSQKVDVLLYQLASYSFIKKLLNVRDLVLDIGCGEGYTANSLADVCHMVAAIDSDSELQMTNRREYGERAVRFYSSSWQDWNPSNVTYSAVVCRDVIEHQTREQTIELIEKVVNHYLRDSNSIFILGTVRKGVVPKRPKEQGHICEWENVELQHVLERYFHRVIFFSQTDETVSLLQYPGMAWRWIILCTGPKIPVKFADMKISTRDD